MTDAHKDGMKSLNRIESMVNAISGVLEMTRRKTLTAKMNDSYADIPNPRINLTRTVWSADNMKELLGWVYEDVDTNHHTTSINIHMTESNAKYLVIEYTVTNKDGNEIDYRATWAEGFTDAKVTLAVVMNLDHPNQVVFE
jgi:hypothetical protein